MITINGDESIFIKDNKVVINGVEYKKPGHGNTFVTSDNKVYVNGYELKNGKFKRTLAAIINCIF